MGESSCLLRAAFGIARFHAKLGTAARVGGGRQQLGEGLQLGHVQIRYGPIFQPGVSPVEQVITLPGIFAHDGLRAVFIRQDENIDDMPPVTVGDGGDGALFKVVQASAQQGVAFVREIPHRWGEIQASVKPWLNGMLVRGGDVGQMIDLQGAYVAVDDALRHPVLSGARPQQQAGRPDKAGRERAAGAAEARPMPG